MPVGYYTCTQSPALGEMGTEIASPKHSAEGPTQHYRKGSDCPDNRLPVELMHLSVFPGLLALQAEESDPVDSASSDFYELVPFQTPNVLF